MPTDQGQWHIVKRIIEAIAKINNANPNVSLYDDSFFIHAFYFAVNANEFDIVQQIIAIVPTVVKKLSWYQRSASATADSAWGQPPPRQ